MGRKKTTNYYWTDDTEKAIIAYNGTANSSKRNKLYNDEIEYPLNKLSENIISKYKHLNKILYE